MKVATTDQIRENKGGGKIGVGKSIVAFELRSNLQGKGGKGIKGKKKKSDWVGRCRKEQEKKEGRKTSTGSKKLLGGLGKVMVGKFRWC